MYEGFINENPEFKKFVENTDKNALRAARWALRVVGIRNIVRLNIDRNQRIDQIEDLHLEGRVPVLNKAIYYTLFNKKDPPASMNLADEGKYYIYEGLKDALNEAGFYLTKENALHAPKLTSIELATIVDTWTKNQISKLIKSSPSKASENAKKEAEGENNDFIRFLLLNKYYQDPANKHRSFRKALNKTSVFTSQLNASEAKEILEVFSNKPEAEAEPEAQGTNPAGFFVDREKKGDVKMKPWVTSAPNLGKK